MKKYELTEETKGWCGKTLHRIRALIDIGDDVKAGDLGGWVQSEDNLSQDGDCWVFGDAKVFGNAEVYGNAIVFGNAEVYGNACVLDSAMVFGDAIVRGDAIVCGDACVFDSAMVFGDAKISDSKVYGNSEIGKVANVQSTSDYITIGPIGSRKAFTTFYRAKNNEIYVTCGCKNTDIDTWLGMVEERHGNNEHGQAYRDAANFVRNRFRKDTEDEIKEMA